jgi:hypothetical protein
VPQENKILPRCQAKITSPPDIKGPPLMSLILAG